ncbi:hypothetical protein LPB72_01860 [Hydrogenophaga crassostreae]|uniref:Uncharacterized protein n=1 Tax=Hydrogenophaga crassostreae TaxID=1763535 RepID=A0ABX2UCR8_9BURK|nr:hypothetical protein LPB72_01860 [Hydrogenophaga crassostreae]
MNSRETGFILVMLRALIKWRASSINGACGSGLLLGGCASEAGRRACEAMYLLHDGLRIKRESSPLAAVAAKPKMKN